MFLVGLDNLEKYVNTCLVVCLGCMLTFQICIMTLVYAMHHKELCGYVSGCQLYCVRHFGTAIPLINSLN